MKAPNTTLWIPPNIYSQLMFYAFAVDAEVGGFGTVFFDEKENDITVGELFLVKQEVHQTECNLKAEGTAALYQELIDKGEPEKINDIAFWWHSHKNMQASFSSIDDDLMRNWTAEYLVSLVINRDGKMSAQLMTKTPLLVVGDIDVEVNWFDIPEYDDWMQEVKEKVTKAIPAPKMVASTQSKNPQYKWADKEHTKWTEKGFQSMTIEEWEKYEEEQNAEFDIEVQQWMENSE